MEWKEAYPQDKQPTLENMADYIGGSQKELWNSLMDYMATAYMAKPKIAYSGCTGKPGWNVKFQKSGQSFGTLYPEQNSFSVFIVFSYKLEPLMDAILPIISSEIAELYKNAGDYMKLGKWMMFQIKDSAGLEDYKKLISIKLQPK